MTRRFSINQKVSQDVAKVTPGGVTVAGVRLLLEGTDYLLNALEDAWVRGVVSLPEEALRVVSGELLRVAAQCRDLGVPVEVAVLSRQVLDVIEVVFAIQETVLSALNREADSEPVVVRPEPAAPGPAAPRIVSQDMSVGHQLALTWSWS